MTPSHATGLQEEMEETADGPAEHSCLQQTTIKVANRDLVITLQDAERIKQTVEKYLAAEKPKLDSSVSGPGEVFIDCWGKVRMGAWLLESSWSDEPELSLTFRMPTGENIRVQQVIRLRQAEGQWKVADVGTRISHLKRE
jgi:hypothetical protein